MLAVDALDPGAHDFAAERGESGRWVDASIPAPVIVRLRSALATLPLPPIENDLDAGRAGEGAREVVVERRVPARDDHEEPPAPLSHKDDLSKL